MSMDIGKAFTFMFSDPDWLRKLGIGTLVMLAGIIFSPVLIGLIPLVIVTGYTLDVTRNVLDGQTNPLPQWEDWGGFLSRGFKLCVVYIVWALPLIVAVIPWAIGAAISGNASYTNGGGANILGSLFMFCGGCLMVLWTIVLVVMSPAIYVKVARTDSIGAGLDIPALWTFTRNNLSNVIVAVLLYLVAGFIASIAAMLGIIAIVIGLLVTIPLAALWQMLVEAHLFGQVGRINEGRTAPVV
jgi:hypothetical protein